MFKIQDGNGSQARVGDKKHYFQLKRCDSAFFHSKLNYLNSLFDLNFVSVFMFLFFFVMPKNADTD